MVSSKMCERLFLFSFMGLCRVRATASRECVQNVPLAVYITIQLLLQNDQTHSNSSN